MVKGLREPSRVPEAFEFIARPAVAGPAVDKGRSSDRMLPTSKDNQHVPLGRGLGDPCLMTQTTRTGGQSSITTSGREGAEGPGEDRP